jgi:hypothetical protein
MPSGEPQFAYSVIDKVIQENRPAEWLLYIVSTVVVGAGIFTIVFGALREQALLALVGSVPSAMIFPAYLTAREIRRENMAIRLLEAPLRMAQTSEEAARAISVVFLQTFGQTPRGS